MSWSSSSRLVAGRAVVVVVDLQVAERGRGCDTAANDAYDSQFRDGRRQLLRVRHGQGRAHSEQEGRHRQPMYTGSDCFLHLLVSLFIHSQCVCVCVCVCDVD